MIPQLEAWDNFYVIVGSSAAALTGLMFVVIALIADDTLEAPKSSGRLPPSAPERRALLRRACGRRRRSARHGARSRTWRAPSVFAACGRGLHVDRPASCATADAYKPVLEDWLCHTVFPLASYTAIVIASVLLSRNLERSLFAVAAAVLSLVLIGIHNAWDTVTYLAMGEQNRQNASQNTEK